MQAIMTLLCPTPTPRALIHRTLANATPKGKQLMSHTRPHWAGAIITQLSPALSSYLLLPPRAHCADRPRTASRSQEKREAMWARAKLERLKPALQSHQSIFPAGTTSIAPGIGCKWEYGHWGTPLGKQTWDTQHSNRFHAKDNMI